MGRRGVADCNLSARNAADQEWRLGCASCPTAREPMVVKTHQHKHTVKHRYELLETLGKGTFGKVKKAVQREGGKTVAIKSIRKERLSDGQDKAHIQREIEITSSLSHPNIICIYEVFESRDKIVMVMEYASGGELYDYLQDRGRLSETDAKHYFRQITSAVHYCHKNGVVHRDLKLENILLDKDSNIKLADFGLSNRYQRGSLLQTFCGSPLYASPEIINGLPYVGPEVDCWALGVLLYALVHGSMPFDGGNYSCLREQISHGKYRRPKLQTDACTLIGWLLTVKVEDRATVEDVANHWWVNWICPSPVRDCRSSHRPHDLSPLILPEHLTPDPQKCLNISQSVSGGQTAVTTFPKKSRTEITNLTRTNHAETSPSCALASPTHNQPVEPPKKGILKRLHQRVEEPTSPPRTCDVREAIGGCPGDTATSRDVGGERTRMDEGRKRKGILKRNSHFSGQERWLMACPESGTTSSVMASVA